MMDEVAIRKQQDYDRTSDMMVGYADMGVEISDMGGLPLAHEASTRGMAPAYLQRLCVPISKAHNTHTTRSSARGDLTTELL